MAVPASAANTDNVYTIHIQPKSLRVSYSIPYQPTMCSRLVPAAAPSRMLRRSLLEPQEWLYPWPTGTIWGVSEGHIWTSANHLPLLWVVFPWLLFCPQHQMQAFHLGHWQKELHPSVMDRIWLAGSTELGCFSQTVKHQTLCVQSSVCRNKQIIYKCFWYHMKHTGTHASTHTYVTHLSCFEIDIIY